MHRNSVMDVKSFNNESKQSLHQEKKSIIEKATEALKKLQITLFRNKQAQSKLGILSNFDQTKSSNIFHQAFLPMH